MQISSFPLALYFLGIACALHSGIQKFEPFDDQNAGNGPPSSFLAGRGLACFEGQARIVEGALALKKTGPRGALYKNEYAQANTTCLSRGFSEIQYPDACYPGLMRHYSFPADQLRFLSIERNALRRFSNLHRVAPARAELMNACACHDDSSLHQKRAAECKRLWVHGSFIEHNPDNGEPLLCHGGHYIATTRALATLKSSPNLPMHKEDYVQPIPCAAQGFRFRATKYDNCFADVHTFTKTNAEKEGEDLGIKKASVSEKKLVQQSGFAAFAARNSLNEAVLDGIEGCQCSPSSKVGSSMGKLCWQPGASSPIRDWWRD